MRPLEFIVTLSGGVLVPPPDKAFFVTANEGKQARVTLSWRLEKSSSKQRKYYFATIVPAFQDYWYATNGIHYDKDTMHDMMMRSVGGFSNPLVNPFTGEPDCKRLSYNDLTMVQCEGYHHLCRAWAASKGVDISEPNENNR